MTLLKTRTERDCFTIVTARKRSLGQGNIFRSVCQEFCPHGGGCAWLQGGMCGCLGGGRVSMCGCQGVCVVARGHAWLQGAVWLWGCAWLLGGMHGCRGWHAWLPGGMRGWGSVLGCGGHVWLLGGCIGYDKIRSMSGRYASYWNACLF